MNRVKCFLLIFSSTFFIFHAHSQGKALSSEDYLMVLDVQQYYTSGALPDSSVKKMIDSINYLINSIEDDKVLYVKRTHKLLNISLSFPLIYSSTDSCATQFDKRLVLISRNIFQREKANAFAHKELTDFLHQSGAKRIVIIGLLADEFLCKSAIRGQKLGYDIFIIPEAILGKKPAQKDRAIKRMRKKGVKILRMDEAFYQ